MLLTVPPAISNIKRKRFEISARHDLICIIIFNARFLPKSVFDQLPKYTINFSIFDFPISILSKVELVKIAPPFQLVEKNY